MPDTAAQFTLIAFDVSDNRRRRQVARVLLAAGHRVQRSVFEAWLTPAQRQRLERRLAEVLDPEHDRLDVFVLRPLDADRIVVEGYGARTEMLNYAIV